MSDTALASVSLEQVLLAISKKSAHSEKFQLLWIPNYVFIYVPTTMNMKTKPSTAQENYWPDLSAFCLHTSRLQVGPNAMRINCSTQRNK
eukprot:TRINITY_DN30492_c0_g1_i1.p1 TRINITY_DN30492_c0_g1~~TRINITY_DN30492_c0_g1_i1.p1  ORF type:complete len:105 (-),score=4.30 TRINITY_DN30492_c0_g1_i1:51-320(-)